MTTSIGTTRSPSVPWQRTWSSASYAEAVQSVRRAIARGDVYQVNLVQHLAAEFTGDPAALAARLASLKPHNREPYRGDGWAIVSGSPELFLARRGSRLWTSPIKGTRPAGSESELAGSAKDRAEHVMIVDLERNDLSRVCVPGSVRWPELMATRQLAGVEHMVSTVEGTLRDGVGLAEILRATFPGGSITGAPKIAAVDLIAELEPVGRGASMGALGRVQGNGDFDLALTIRTFAIAGGRIHLWVGGGIVWDSDPAAEIAESWTKARPVLRRSGRRWRMTGSMTAVMPADRIGRTRDDARCAWKADVRRSLPMTSCLRSRAGMSVRDATCSCGRAAIGVTRVAGPSAASRRAVRGAER